MAKQIEIDLIIETAGSERSIAEAKKAIKDLQKSLRDLGPEADDAFVGKVNNAIAQTKAQLSDLQADIDSVRPDKIGNAFLNVGQTIAGAFQVASGALTAFGGNSEQLEQVQTRLLAISNIAGGIGNLKESIEDFGRSFKVINAIVKANPIITIVTAAVGLFTVLASKSQALKNVIGGLFEVVGLLGKGIDSLVTGFSNLIDGIFGLEKGYEELTPEAKKAAEAQRQFNKEIKDATSTLAIEILRKKLLRGEISEEIFERARLSEARKAADRQAEEEFQKRKSEADELRKTDEKAAKEEEKRAKLILANKKLLNKETFDNAILSLENRIKEEDKKEREAAKEERDRKTKQINDDEKAYQDEITRLRTEFVLTEEQRINKEFDDRKKLVRGKTLEEVELLKALETERDKRLKELAKNRTDAELKRLKDISDAEITLRRERIAAELDAFRGTEEQKLAALKDFADRELKLLDEQQANQIRGVTEGSLEYKQIVQKFDLERLKLRKDISDAETKILLDNAEKERKTREEQLDLLTKRLENVKETIAIIADLGQTIFSNEQSRLDIEQQLLQQQFQLRREYIQKNIQDEKARAAAIQQLDSELFSKENELQKRRIELQKRQIKFERNVTVATIALNTAISIANTVKGATSAAAATGPAYIVTYALTLAAGLASVIGTIAKANQALKQADLSGLSGGGSSPSFGGLSISQTSQNVTPQAGLQQIGAFTAEQQQQFQVFVTETDISKVIKKVDVIQTNSQFG